MTENPALAEIDHIYYAANQAILAQHAKLTAEGVRMTPEGIALFEMIDDGYATAVATIFEKQAQREWNREQKAADSISQQALKLYGK